MPNPGKSSPPAFSGGWYLNRFGLVNNEICKSSPQAGFGICSFALSLFALLLLTFCTLLNSNKEQFALHHFSHSFKKSQWEQFTLFCQKNEQFSGKPKKRIPNPDLKLPLVSDILNRFGLLTIICVKAQLQCPLVVDFLHRFGLWKKIYVKAYLHFLLVADIITRFGLVNK